jgi:hypothetical protein
MVKIYNITMYVTQALSRKDAKNTEIKVFNIVFMAAKATVFYAKLIRFEKKFNSRIRTKQYCAVTDGTKKLLVEPTRQQHGCSTDMSATRL